MPTFDKDRVPSGLLRFGSPCCLAFLIHTRPSTPYRWGLPFPPPVCDDPPCMILSHPTGSDFNSGRAAPPPRQRQFGDPQFFRLLPNRHPGRQLEWCCPVFSSLAPHFSLFFVAHNPPNASGDPSGGPLQVFFLVTRSPLFLGSSGVLTPVVNQAFFFLARPSLPNWEAFDP